MIKFNKISLYLTMGLMLVLSLFFVASVSNFGYEGDYFGTLNYFEQYNYSFYINQSAKHITFTGLEPISNQYAVVPYNSSNEFLVRINYIWEQGWFDTLNLYVNEYAPTPTFYASNVSEISPGIYFASFMVDEIPYFDFRNVTLNVTLNNLTGESFIESSEYPILNSSSKMFLVNNTQVSGHIYLPILLETRFVQNIDQNTAQLHINVKTDFSQNGLSTHWVNALHTPLEEYIQLVSPSNNQLFQTTSNEMNIDFQFFINQSLFNSTENVGCISQVINNNTFLELPSIVNNLTLEGNSNLSMAPGNYKWRAYCKTSQDIIVSQVNSFIIEKVALPEETITLTDNDDDGGRRRRPINSLENLSLSQTQNITADDSRNSAISLITGAVIGVLGEKGTMWLGVFIVLLAITLLIIYNREQFGLVKKTD